LSVVLLAFVSIARRPVAMLGWPWRRVVPLAVAAVAMALFAASWQVRLWGRIVLDLEPTLVRFESIAAPFRSSGRFVWPLYYLVLAGSLLALSRAWSDRSRTLSAMLALLLALQVAEAGAHPLGNGETLLTRFESPAWAGIRGRYKHLALFPAEVVNACNGRVGYRSSVVVSLAYLAYVHGLSFNSGYVARWSPRMAAQCASEIGDVTAGRIDPETLYVLSPEDRELFLRAGSACGTIDGLLVCARPRTAGPFTEYLREQAR
jgi:hypothetical protein